MITRRRKWLIAAAFVLLAGAALWWAVPSGGKMEVKLVFLGYTNRLVRLNLSNQTTTAAVIMATNISRTTVEIFPNGESHWQAIQTKDEEGLQGFEPAAGVVFPARLRPGDTCFFEMAQVSFQEPWSVKLPVVNRGWRSRLDAQWRRLFGTGMPRWVKAMTPSVFDGVATLGPITNLPPAGAGAGAAPASGAR